MQGTVKIRTETYPARKDGTAVYLTSTDVPLRLDASIARTFTPLEKP